MGYCRPKNQKTRISYQSLDPFEHLRKKFHSSDVWLSADDMIYGVALHTLQTNVVIISSCCYSASTRYKGHEINSSLQTWRNYGGGPWDFPLLGASPVIFLTVDVASMLCRHFFFLCYSFLHGPAIAMAHCSTGSLRRISGVPLSQCVYNTLILPRAHGPCPTLSAY